MENKLNLKEKLDFTEIDFTAPEKVVKDFLEELSNETGGLILGDIGKYAGHVTSYYKSGFSAITAAISGAGQEVNIQSDLGRIGMEEHKFECYLYTPEYEQYKYRVFFLKYNIAHYPVSLTLEESVAKSISNTSKYIFTCKDKQELEDLLFRIFTSKKMIEIMQELIRINQSKKIAKIEQETVLENTTNENDSTD